MNMLYYSNEARKSALDSIDRCLQKMSSIPGDNLSYMESAELSHHLIDLRKVIENEMKQHKSDK